MTLDDLSDQWPDWTFWRSAHNQFVCATRRTQIPLRDLGRLSQTLIADDLPSLVTALHVEHDIQSRTFW